MQSALEIQGARHAYAEELRAVSNLRSKALVKAFATVPREQFLGPGPWQIPAPAALGRREYRTTEDADPRHLYHNVLVAIDADRGLNNGEPSSLALWFDALDLQTGERAIHIGCGVGYYTAILAEVVGPAGHIIGIEVDATLAARARNNLAHLKHVTVVTGDGAMLEPETADAVFVNAGATHPRIEWLNSLRVGGRLMVPLTTTVDALDHTEGGMLRVTRKPNGYDAPFVSRIAIFPCAGARDPESNALLADALGAGSLEAVNSLRTHQHDADATCWLHGKDFCLSTSEI